MKYENDTEIAHYRSVTKRSLKGLSPTGGGALNWWSKKEVKKLSEHEDGLMSIKEVAKHLSVSPRSVSRWIKNRIIPESIVMKVGNGKLVRIRRSDLDTWLKTTNKEVKNDG